MAKNNWDRETYVLFPIFALATGVTLGLVSESFLPFIDLGDVWLETVSADWTVGRLLAIAALLGVTVNRDVSISDTNGIDLWVLVATVALIVTPPFLPEIANTLNQTSAGLVAWLLQSMGFAIITYKN